jgi:hypothetical protein
MNRLMVKIVFLLSLIGLVAPAAFAGPVAKVMVLDFQLNDLTDLPNAPEELARIELLTSAFRRKLANNGVEIVPVNDALKAELSAYSATYLFDRVDHAAKLAEGSGADYLIVGVAMKPTYLFVYPRLRMVDVKTQKGVLSTYAQLESSWTDENTTVNTAERLANKVSEKLRELAGKANR